MHAQAPATRSGAILGALPLFALDTGDHLKITSQSLSSSRTMKKRRYEAWVTVLLSIAVAVTAAPCVAQRQPDRPGGDVTGADPNVTTGTLDLRSLATQLRPAIALIIVSDKAGREVKTGTGFFVSSDGKLVTNAHVVEGGDRAVAKLENGAIYTVRGVLSAAADKDLVILDVDAKDVPTIPLSSSQPPEVGTPIAVIGSPLGLEGTLSSGIVSGNRTAPSAGEWLQITAPVSAGSSGSPVVNLQGDVIGVATFVVAKAQAVNFARPVQYVNDLLRAASTAGEPRPLWSITTDAKNVVRRDPRFVEAVAALRRKDAATALKQLNAIASDYESNEVFQMQLGSVYYQLDLYEDSVEAYRKAVKLDPTNGAAWSSVGLVLHKLNRLEEATDAAKRAVKLSPDYPLAWEVLGLCYATSKQPDRAEDAYARAARLKLKHANQPASTNVSDSPVPPNPDPDIQPNAGGLDPDTAVSATPTSVVERQTYRVARLKRNDVLYVRAGPGLTYPVINKLSAGQRGLLLRRGAKRSGDTVWQEIEVGGNVGWVNAEFITPDPQ